MGRVAAGRWSCGMASRPSSSRPASRAVVASRSRGRAAVGQVHAARWWAVRRRAGGSDASSASRACSAAEARPATDKGPIRTLEASTSTWPPTIAATRSSTSWSGSPRQSSVIGNAGSSRRSMITGRPAIRDARSAQSPNGTCVHEACTAASRPATAISRGAARHGVTPRVATASTKAGSRAAGRD